MSQSKKSKQHKELVSEIKKTVRDYQEIKAEIEALDYEIKNPVMRMTAVYSDMPRGGGGGNSNGIEKALSKRDRQQEERAALYQQFQMVQTLAFNESIILDFVESGESYRGFAKQVGVSRWKVCKMMDDAIDRHVSKLLGGR